jgi:hypothetical protein
MPGAGRAGTGSPGWRGQDEEARRRSAWTGPNESHRGPTNDRRVLGVINDFGRMVEVYLDGRPLPEGALHLADAPCGPIDMERPRDVARELFSASALHLVNG